MKKDRPEAGDSFSPMNRRTTIGGEFSNEDDVEGHGVHARGPHTRESEDDVEGHGVHARGPHTR